MLNKRAAARRAYPSRMSGTIDLITLQLFLSPSRGGCHSAWMLERPGSSSPPSHRAAVSIYLMPSRSVFLIRHTSGAGSLNPIAPSVSLSVLFSLDYQCH